MSGQHVKTATDDNFEAEVLGSSLPALVDFWAVWCGPCKALAPVIDDLANEFQGKINVFKLNVDENPETAARFGIRGIPTILLFKGGKVFQQSVGVVPRESLKEIILSALG
ncbi:MAG: thioredoxin [Deltaproteobacteria bacterium]|nr:thioredoxin [Deltaproteobacteria bacterium]